MARKRELVVKTRNREIRKVKVSDLVDAPFNFRRHSDRQSDALNGAIDEIGVFGYPDVFETADGKLMLCDGHLRKALYTKKYGKDAIIEVNVTDFNEAEAKKATLTKDPIAAMADTDAAALADLIAQVDIGSESVLGMLRDLAIASTILEEELIDFEEDEVPEPPEDPITKTGDLWILGDNHRVLCGDSTKREDVERVLGGKKAFAVITDPPYGVEYVGKTKDALPVHNDGADTLLPLLTASLGLAHEVCRKGGAWYVAAPAGPQFYDFATVLRSLGVWRQTLVWVKSTIVMGHSDYHYQHEVIFYGWSPGAAHIWLSDRRNTTVQEDVKPSDPNKLTKPQLVELVKELIDQANTIPTTVIREPKPHRSEMHPTMKPVRLFARFINNSVQRSQVVYDPFIGSGTTLIAAEKLERNCVGIELSPSYVDVVIHRWENLTGKKAVLAER